MESLSLHDLLDPRAIATGLHVADWEEAVDAIGALLVAGEITTPDYTPAMKKTLRELGPYAVIAPGIAMPHARPEDGVLRTGFALATLANPVDFGNANNDPVDIVLGFAALDKHTHILALQQIAQLFGDAEAVALIRQAVTQQDLSAVIAGQGNHSEGETK